jgi:hypothetical protein
VKHHPSPTDSAQHDAVAPPQLNDARPPEADGAGDSTDHAAQDIATTPIDASPRSAAEPDAAPATPVPERDDTKGQNPPSREGASSETWPPPAPEGRGLKEGAEAKPATGKAEQLTPDEEEVTQLVPGTTAAPGNAATEAASTMTQAALTATRTGAEASPAGNMHAGPFDLEKVRAYAASLGYNLHPILFTFPPKTPDEFERFKETVLRAGRLEVKVKTWKGSIIDGLHRLRACYELDITPEFEEWDGQGSLVVYVTTLNYQGRQDTKSQRAATAVELLPYLEEEAKERQRQHGQTAPGRNRRTLPEKIPGVFEGDAREHAARLCGTNAHYVSDLAWVREQDPELFAQVRAGQLNVPEAVEALQSREQEECPAPRPGQEGEDGQQDGGQPEAATDASREGDASSAEDASGSAAAVTKRPARRKRSASKGKPARGRKSRTAGSENTSSANGNKPETRPPADGASPRFFLSDDPQDSPRPWTRELVDQALAQVAQFTVRLTAFANEPEVREAVRQMDRQGRDRHRATFVTFGKALQGLIELLADEQA